MVDISKSSGAETRIFQDNLDITLAADDLAHFVTRPSATLIVPAQKKNRFLFSMMKYINCLRHLSVVKCWYTFVFPQTSSAQRRLIVFIVPYLQNVKIHMLLKAALPQQPQTRTLSEDDTDGTIRKPSNSWYLISLDTLKAYILTCFNSETCL